MEMLSIWWVWLCIALALGILEVLAPGYIFLGIAIGAAITAGVVALPIDLGIEPTLAIFALLSLAAWAVLRKVFKPRDDQTRFIHEDINK